MSDKTGGPAFPMAGFTAISGGKAETLYAPVDGMTLRDYFAAQVAGTLIGYHGFTPSFDNYEKAAADSYTFADAMLSERAKAGA